MHTKCIQTHLNLCNTSPDSPWSHCLRKRELVFVLIVHLFVSYAHVNLCHFAAALWLFMDFSIYLFGKQSIVLGNYRELCACASRIIRHVSRTRRNISHYANNLNNIQTRIRLRLYALADTTSWMLSCNTMTQPGFAMTWLAYNI